MPQSRPQETNVTLFWQNPAKLFFCFTNDFFFQTFWQRANRMPKQDSRAGSGQYLVWMPLPLLPNLTPTPGLFWGG